MCTLIRQPTLPHIFVLHWSLPSCSPVLGTSSSCTIVLFEQSLLHLHVQVLSGSLKTCKCTLMILKKEGCKESGGGGGGKEKITGVTERGAGTILVVLWQMWQWCGGPFFWVCICLESKEALLLQPEAHQGSAKWLLWTSSQEKCLFIL